MSIALNVGSSFAIPDYATLKTTIADWLDRDDLDTKIAQFVQLAEAMFNRELRTGEMETTTILTATSETVALPADYLAMRAIYIEGSPDRPLRGVAPSALREEFDGTTGTPQAYALVAGVLRLEPPPASTTYLNLDYFASITNLSDANPSNWLLEKHPDAYLYGTLFYAEQLLDNPTRAGMWKALLDEVLRQIKREATNNRYGAGPLVPNTVRQVPGSKC
jgi:hypothetical protein